MAGVCRAMTGDENLLFDNRGDRGISSPGDSPSNPMFPSAEISFVEVAIDEPGSPSSLSTEES